MQACLIGPKTGNLSQVYMISHNSQAELTHSSYKKELMTQVDSCFFFIRNIHNTIRRLRGLRTLDFTFS